MTAKNTPRDVTLPDNLDHICHVAGELEDLLYYAQSGQDTAIDPVAYFNQAVAKFHELATAMGYSVTPLILCPMSDFPQTGEFVLMYRKDLPPIVVNQPLNHFRGVWEKSRDGWHGCAQGGEGIGWTSLPPTLTDYATPKAHADLARVMGGKDTREDGE